MTIAFAKVKNQFYNDYMRTYFDQSHYLKQHNFTDASKLTNMAKITIMEAAITNAHNASEFVRGNSGAQHTTNEDILKRRIEIQKKFTLAAACFILFFIGAPLGAIIRKGGLGMPVVASALFFVVFYILTIIGIKSVVEEAMIVPVGMWMPSFIAGTDWYFLNL